MNWINNSDTIIFGPDFNEELDTVLISAYSKLIFSDYILNEKLFDSYANNNFDALCTLDSNLFDKDVSRLHPILTFINFGWRFNQDVSNLPQSLTHQFW